MTLLLILALMAAVLFLLAERNQRRYFLQAQGRLLVIDRGLLLPYGHAPFHPSDPADASTYRPFELPPRSRFPAMRPSRTASSSTGAGRTCSCKRRARA